MASRVEAIAETALSLLFHADNISASKFAEIEADIKEFAENFQKEFQRIHDFKFEPHWKTRVINVPKAIDGFKQLIALLSTDLTKKIRALAQPFEDFKIGR